MGAERRRGRGLLCRPKLRLRRRHHQQQKQRHLPFHPSHQLLSPLCCSSLIPVFIITSFKYNFLDKFHKKMTASSNPLSSPSSFGDQQQQQKSTEMLRKTKKDAAVKAKQKPRQKRNSMESPLQREQRLAVLEQLREMVGCQKGCSQFEIVQRVIRYIGQLNAQLCAVAPCQTEKEADAVNTVRIDQQQLSAALNQLVASLSLICRPGNAKKMTAMPRTQRTR